MNVHRLFDRGLGAPCECVASACSQPQLPIDPPGIFDIGARYLLPLDFLELLLCESRPFYKGLAQMCIDNSSRANDAEAHFPNGSDRALPECPRWRAELGNYRIPL